jgi:hypothetical protein
MTTTLVGRKYESSNLKTPQKFKSSGNSERQKKVLSQSLWLISVHLNCSLEWHIFKELRPEKPQNMKGLAAAKLAVIKLPFRTLFFINPSDRAV